MSGKMELVGKTISGLVASQDAGDGLHRIWLLQFTDGTHVEFVSPGARRNMRKVSASPQLPLRHRGEHPQMALNVA
jgi:hypothetical protein